MLGPGRAAKEPAILEVRRLTKEEVLTAPRANIGVVAKLRESHHRIARLKALGLRNFQIAEETGYSAVTISQLNQSPAFRELVAQYRGEEDEALKESRDEYYKGITLGRIASARRIVDLLLDEEETFTVAQLVSIHSDFADRTGYPKRNVAVNVNIDFASRLDRAIARTNMARTTIDLTPEPSSPEIGGEGEEPALRQPPPQLFRRRA